MSDFKGEKPMGETSRLFFWLFFFSLLLCVAVRRMRSPALLAGGRSFILTHSETLRVACGVTDLPQIRKCRGEGCPLGTLLECS